MSASVRPESIAHRVNVDVENDAAGLVLRLKSLATRAPSGGVDVVHPFGFAYRREPDVFAAIGIGTALGFGLLLLVYTIHAPTTIIGRAGSATSFLVALLLVARFLRNHVARWEVVVDGDVVESRMRIGSRIKRTLRTPADEIVSVLVLRDDGVPRIALGGPRHRIVAELFELNALDPETLGPYLADLVATVAKRASCRQ